ncbi:unnamed protein product [Tilletia controversa]|nr:unnamed protein product [Tilletia controversa]CAD6916529.1 unnamed protein product [Tilletia caries]CAD6926705.1 unnamed protein product [Tilletia laevis]CAD6940798.1 unnamed protein product [Tilletia laevis]CAD6944481.1 unnamed protein product [Tilletia controversa]
MHNAIKCFASHINSASLLPALGFPQPVYLLERRPFIHAEIVGMVVGVTEKESRIVYLVDDGTAVLQVIEVLGETGIRKKLRNVGDVVRVVGKIRREWEERALYAHSINLLSDLYAEIQHIHAVALALRTTYQEPLDLASLPTAHLPSPNDHSAETLSEQPRKTTIPPEYLPPVYTNANYYSNAAWVGERYLGGQPIATLPSPDATPPGAKTSVRYQNVFPQFASSPASAAPSSSSLGEGSSFGGGGHRRLRAWYKLKGSELSASRFRPYVAQHIHAFCSTAAAAAGENQASTSRSPPAFTVRYLRRQVELRNHAESVVLRELEKRETKLKSSGVSASSSSISTSSSKHGKQKKKENEKVADDGIQIRKQASKLSSEALAAKVKRLFESIIRQLVDDGVIEIAPECVPLRWPFNGRKFRFRPTQSKTSTAAFRGGGGRGGHQQQGKRWGGTAAEMFLSVEDVEIPFLGSSDSETESQGNEKDKGKGKGKSKTPTTSGPLLRTPKPASRPGPSRRIVIEIPSSSGASATLDSQGRTRTPMAVRLQPNRQRTKKARGTNPVDDAISISSGSGPGSSSSSSTSSSAGITSDTESESSSDEEDGRTSPTPRAKRRTLLGKGVLLDTQRAADVWRQGGVKGTKRRGRQEAYRLTAAVSGLGF